MTDFSLNLVLHQPLEEKPVTLAIHEVADGLLKAKIKDEYLV